MMRTRAKMQIVASACAWRENVPRQILLYKRYSCTLLVYHKIGRIPPFLVGGGMNATITIHRQM